VTEFFWLEITGEEPENFAAYGDACAALNRWADDLQAKGWHVDRGWASRDNLYAVHATAPGAEANERFGQVVTDECAPPTSRCCSSCVPSSSLRSWPASAHS
jgi:hypothetical protein